MVVLFALTGETPLCISALCQSDEPSKKTPPSVPQGEISVNMHVLARRRELNWQRGEIIEILKKGKFKKKKSMQQTQDRILFDTIAIKCL